MTPRLLILGASARAAAFSAKRAGFEPWAVDCFADQDLLALGPVTAITEYPQDFLSAVTNIPPTPWLYTGGLENFPAIVDEISKRHPLLGNAGVTLAKVRDPFVLQESLRGGGFCSPDITSIETELHQQAERTWLIKPLRSGGGQGICFWERKKEGESSKGPTPTVLCQTKVRPEKTHFFQRYLEGDAIGAIFIGCDRRAVLLGVTSQLTGCAWAGASEFHYCGSVGEYSLSEAVENELRAIGEHLVKAFQLKGIFGVDAIVADERVWTLEVNPRYTASVEILERTLGVHAVSWHVQACRGQFSWPVGKRDSIKQPQTISGKAIVYAMHDVETTDAFTEFVNCENYNRTWPTICDVPPPGTKIQRGQPIVTVFGECSHDARENAVRCNKANVVHSLQQAATKVLSFFEKDRRSP